MTYTPLSCRHVALISTAAWLTGCASVATPPTPVIAPETPFAVQTLPRPVGAVDPVDQRLTTGPDGHPIALWWQPQNRLQALRFASLQHGHWSPATTLTVMPNIIEAQAIGIGEHQLAAMWMTSIKPDPAADAEAHQIYVIRSADDGRTWSPPLHVNLEPKVSAKESPVMTALADGTLLFTWADQRYVTMTPPKVPGGEPTFEGASALIGTTLGPDNQLGKELVLDKDFCECCGPALTSGDQEGLLVYRDHQADNVRDPAVLRFDRNGAHQSRIVHADHWIIEGCPSRGPAIARSGPGIGVAWLTTVDDQARIRTAFSKDTAQSFSPPIELQSEGATWVVGIAMEDPDTAIVSWVATDKEGFVTRLARVHADGRITNLTTVDTLKAGKYQYPGPRMTKAGDAVVLSWTEEESKQSSYAQVRVR